MADFPQKHPFLVLGGGDNLIPGCKKKNFSPEEKFFDDFFWAERGDRDLSKSGIFVDF